MADCNAVDVTLNLYDNLFTVDEPLSDENKDRWLEFLNPDSLVVVKVRVVAVVVVWAWRRCEGWEQSEAVRALKAASLFHARWFHSCTV